MLGQPVSMLVPQVVGFKLTGKLKEGTTATDLVLTVTEMLRSLGVVGKFVEFYGPGIAVSCRWRTGRRLRIWLRSMGRRAGSFPVDKETLRIPAADGAKRRAHCAVRGVLPRAGAVSHGGCDRRPSTRRRCIAGSALRWSRAWRGRSGRRIGCCCERRRRALRKQLPSLQGPNANKRAERQMVRWEGEGGHASATGDVTSGAGSPAPEVPEHGDR